MFFNPGVASAAKNAPATGQILISVNNNTNIAWDVPEGVTSISVVCIARGSSVVSSSGYGGALRYVNNISVTPGERMIIRTEATQSFIRRNSGDTSFLCAAIGRNAGVGTGFNGGQMSNLSSYPRAGPGAAGFTSDGQNASNAASGQRAGGGGTDPRVANSPGALAGIGSSGTYGTAGGNADNYGGGPGVGQNSSGLSRTGSPGAGCVYIIWGPNRAFPGTNIQEM